MGFTGARHQWLGFPARLGAGRRLITLDNRGVGLSDAPIGPYRIDMMARDVLAVLGAAGVERASFFGVSMGGMIAQEVALLAPWRVERLILGCSHHGGDGQVLMAPGDMQKLAPQRGRPAGDTLRALLELNFSATFMAQRPDVIDELIAYGLRHRMPHAGFMGQLGAITGHDTAGRLPSLRCPTLVLTGDADRLIPHENSRLLAALIPGAELRVLPGVGHMFWVEAPDEAARLIVDFLGA